METQRLQLRSITRWLWLNFKVFSLSFVLVGLLVVIFPETMLRVFGQWAILMQAAGARTAAQVGSPAEMFRHILSTNTITLAIYLIIGFLLQSPLVMPFTAAFYGLVAFLAPQTIGRPFNLADWFLIGIEALVFLLGASLTAGLAGDLYQVRPERRSLVQYWKRAWRTLWLRPSVDGRLVWRAWRASLVVGLSVLVSLSLFVAWFETYGY